MPLTRRTILQAALALPAARGQSADTPEMVDVPAGVFTMGDRATAHQVAIDAFRIGRYLVTNAQYKAFTIATGHRPLPRHWRSGSFPAGRDRHPVLWVSWNDAMQYCAWIINSSGSTATLPTDAQWV